MGLRDISDKVVAEIQHGRSKRDIFASLSAQEPSAAGKIAYCIASVPDKALRQKYLRLNSLLFLLLITCSVLTLLSGLPLEEDEPTIFLAITTVAPLLFAYFIFKFHGGVYRLAGIWFLIDLLESILLTGAPDGTAALKTVTLFFIVIIAIFIARKVFPGLGVLGPKKDNSGNYLL
jgi:hypothetical protein